MKTNTVSVSYGRTVNLGNFNSLRFEASVEVELEEGEKAINAIHLAKKLVKAEVETAITADLVAIQDKRDAIFAALPGGK